MKQETSIENEMEYRIALIVLEVLMLERGTGQKIELSVVQELIKEYEESHPKESDE